MADVAAMPLSETGGRGYDAQNIVAGEGETKMSRSIILSSICVAVAIGSASAQSPIDDYTPVSEDMLESPPDGEWPMWKSSR